MGILQPCIEGIPVIIRFKTKNRKLLGINLATCIEGIPVIIRFKTLLSPVMNFLPIEVLKVFQL